MTKTHSEKRIIRLGGVEAGGTSFRVILAHDTPTNVKQRLSLPTLSPEETIPIVAKQLFDWGVDSIGVASFGPIDINKNSPTYGYITSTPKKQWLQTDLLGGIRRELVRLAGDNIELSTKYDNLPIGFQTDVNAAAAVEMLYGGYSTVNSLCYITIGTGIGVGIAMRRPRAIDESSDEENDEDFLSPSSALPPPTVHETLPEPTPAVNNSNESVHFSQLSLNTSNTQGERRLLIATHHRPISMVTNMLHPEAGHVQVIRHDEETIEGCCPFHGSRCCEGLSSNHMVAKRAGVLANQLATISPTHMTWKITGYYIAQLCLNLLYIISPEKIIIGGGLAQNHTLITSVRENFVKLLNGYVKTSQLDDIETYITTSTFLGREETDNISSGIVGALYLAHTALHHYHPRRLTSMMSPLSPLSPL